MAPAATPRRLSPSRRRLRLASGAVTAFIGDGGLLRVTMVLSSDGGTSPSSPLHLPSHLRPLSAVAATAARRGRSDAPPLLVLLTLTRPSPIPHACRMRNPSRVYGSTAGRLRPAAAPPTDSLHCASCRTSATLTFPTTERGGATCVLSCLDWAY
jgi:hypothetical protein